MAEAGEKRIEGWQQALHDGHWELLKKLKVIVGHLKQLGLIRRTRYNLGGAYAESKMKSMSFVSKTMGAEQDHVKRRGSLLQKKASMVGIGAALASKKGEGKSPTGKSPTGDRRSSLKADHTPHSLEPGGF